MAHLTAFGKEERLDVMHVTGEYSEGFPCLRARRHSRICDDEVVGDSDVRPLRTAQ